MNEIIEMLSNPTFWVGTVIVGLIINLFSTFTYQVAGKFIGNWVKKQKILSQKEKNEIDEIAQLAFDNPLFEIRTFLIIASCQISMIFFISIMILVSVISPSRLFTIGFICIYIIFISRLFIDIMKVMRHQVKIVIAIRTKRDQMISLSKEKSKQEP